jgi:hypothetical protein
MNPVKRQEFDRMPKESVKAFTAFNLYLNLGPQRSTQAVAKKLAKSEQLIRRWCAKFGWLERAKAFEAHLAEVEREAIEGLRREKGIEWFKVHEDQRIEEWKLRNEYLETLREGLQRWKADKKRSGTLEGLARLGEVFMKLGRAASGMPMETKEITGEIKATLEVEWEIALKKIYGRPEGQAGNAPAIVDVEEVRPEALGRKPNQSRLTSAATEKEKEKGK